MRREPRVFLQHILLCLDRIAVFTVEGELAFHDDAKTQDAVIRNLEIIGQAVKDLGTGELELHHPGVPWRQIAGLRNVLAHQYLGVDIRLVWNVVANELPALRAAIEASLAQSVPPTR